MAEPKVIEVELPNGGRMLVRVQALDGSGTPTDGPRDVGLEQAVATFHDVEATLTQVGASILGALERIAPARATVEFGLELAVKSGKLLGVLVDGSTAASLKVTLEWKPGAGGHADE